MSGEVQVAELGLFQAGWLEEVVGGVSAVVELVGGIEAEEGDLIIRTAGAKALKRSRSVRSRMRTLV